MHSVIIEDRFVSITEGRVRFGACISFRFVSFRFISFHEIIFQISFSFCFCFRCFHVRVLRFRLFLFSQLRFQLRFPSVLQYGKRRFIQFFIFSVAFYSVLCFVFVCAQSAAAFSQLRLDLADWIVFRSSCSFRLQRLFSFVQIAALFSFRSDCSVFLVEQSSLRFRYVCSSSS